MGLILILILGVSLDCLVSDLDAVAGVLDQLPMTFDRFLRQLRTVDVRDVDSVRPEQ